MSVRVVAGSRRSRLLCVPIGRSTRPTSARVREALFAILGNLEGLRVLDLYAGSGALGIEALSRGARSAVFVERDRNALACIRDNLSSLTLTELASVWPSTVGSALGRLAREPSFDLVLADPPWSEVDQATTELSAISALLSEDGRVVLEHSRKKGSAIAGLSLYDQRTWGETAISFFHRTSSAL